MAPWGVIGSVGTDLCDVPRMERAVARTGRRFLERVFTEREQLRAGTGPRRAAELARAFALKEAVFKAIGRGWPHDIGYTEVSLGDGPGVRVVELTGRAAKWAESAGFARLVGSVCDDGEVAFAIVLSELR